MSAFTVIFSYHYRNSAYGSMLLDKTKHRDIKYIKGDSEAKFMANDILFQRMNDLENENYEIELSKKRIVMNLPIQVGFFILNYAKLRMLEFHYEFLYKFFDRASLSQCQSDTDSYYFSIAEPTLEDILKNDRLAMQYYKSRYENCNDAPYLPNNVDHFLPRICCEHHFFYDNCQPGLYKTEYEADIIVSLCSKCWCAHDREENTEKYSSKGCAASC